MTNKPTDTPTNNPIIIDPRMLSNYYDHDDEISLVDLWLSLVKHRKVFWLTFLIIISLGFVFSISQPTVYDYITTIEIGTKADKETLIQPVETVKSEITSAYINQALHDYYNDNDNDNDIIKVDVENPKDTSLLIIKSSGSIEQEAMHLTIQSKILDTLTRKHSASTQAIIESLQSQKQVLLNQIEDLENEVLFASRKLSTENALKLARTQLEKLLEDASDIETKIARHAALKDLLHNQYKNNIDDLNLALKNQKIAAKGNAETSLLVILTSEIQQYRTHIASLEERLNIDLPAQEQELHQQVADNKRTQENQQVAIQQAEYALSKLMIDRDRELKSLKTQLAELEHDIQALPTTHAVVPPSRSFEPAKNKKSLVIAVSIVLGLFIGLFAALFAGFIAKVKEQGKQ
ncbi:MAG: Wzz/FepE/Etk N-terminal domain-containing protein [Methyloprofundus sp.]|nr:Wzz/FepE/Etk N-terminal domain-containing protein [Methyloprofundus sp.]